jgi:hypothetical protein
MSPVLIILTLTHVVISLVAIASGFVVLAGFFSAKRLDGWTKLFLATTAATSITGFFFPVHRFMPSQAVGIVSLLVLIPCLIARYSRNLAGWWRPIYVVTASAVLYFNVFVLIVQAFLKIPALKALAPTQAEPPFKLTQLSVLVLFIAVTTFAVIRFRPEPPSVPALTA